MNCQSMFVIGVKQKLNNFNIILIFNIINDITRIKLKYSKIDY
jgi:hypothetical protein